MKVSTKLEVFCVNVLGFVVGGTDGCEGCGPVANMLSNEGLDGSVLPVGGAEDVAAGTAGEEPGKPNTSSKPFFPTPFAVALPF